MQSINNAISIYRLHYILLPYHLHYYRQFGFRHTTVSSVNKLIRKKNRKDAFKYVRQKIGEEKNADNNVEVG